MKREGRGRMFRSLKFVLYIDLEKKPKGSRKFKQIC